MTCVISVLLVPPSLSIQSILSIYQLSVTTYYFICCNNKKLENKIAVHLSNHWDFGKVHRTHTNHVSFVWGADRKSIFTDNPSPRQSLDSEMVHWCVTPGLMSLTTNAIGSHGFSFSYWFCRNWMWRPVQICGMENEITELQRRGRFSINNYIDFVSLPKL